MRGLFCDTKFGSWVASGHQLNANALQLNQVTSHLNADGIITDEFDGEFTMNRWPQIAIGLLFSFTTTGQVFAQDGDNSKPALWKWTSSDSKDSNIFNGPQINWPQMPTFQGMRASTSRAYTNAKQTTGRWWNNTVTFLNPWDEESKSKKASNSGGSWFFQKKDETKTYNTVSEFMKQERPKW